jgi:hypothetical protein
MFGDDQQVQDNGVVPPLDPSVMADPSAGQPVTDHQMTPAYPDDSVATNPIQQMHQEAVAASTGPTADTPAPSAPVATPSAGDEELLAIKQDAMGALAPLVGNLEQSPEEKFKTTMMMIQASDDRSLVRTAYEAAQAITDEKMRAQALLDVINEINYFTSHQS